MSLTLNFAMVTFSNGISLNYNFLMKGIIKNKSPISVTCIVNFTDMIIPKIAIKEIHDTAPIFLKEKRSLYEITLYREINTIDEIGL
jgi:hypothetical protein